MTVNERIKKLRKQSNLTQEEMGAILGMKRSTYAHTESFGKFKPEDLKKIAVHFNRTVDEIINGDNFITRKAIENMEKQNEIWRFNETPTNPLLNSESDIDTGYLTNNERILLRSYRNSDEDKRKLLLQLAQQLSTKE